MQTLCWRPHRTLNEWFPDLTCPSDDIRICVLLDVEMSGSRRTRAAGTRLLQLFLMLSADTHAHTHTHAQTHIQTHTRSAKLHQSGLAVDEMVSFGRYLCLLRILSSLSSSAECKAAVAVSGHVDAKYWTSCACCPGRNDRPLPWLYSHSPFSLETRREQSSVTPRLLKPTHHIHQQISLITMITVYNELKKLRPANI